MAVGDVVSDISTSGALLTFQPASGVECMITSVMGATAMLVDLTDGTNLSRTFPTTSIPINFAALRIFVTNTIFLSIPASSAQFLTFTGITTNT